jgi:hypothetical protein
MRYETSLASWVAEALPFAALTMKVLPPPLFGNMS